MITVIGYVSIDESFLNVKSEKEYDLYMWALFVRRGMDVFQKEFTKTNPGKLCLIGNAEDDIYNTYKTIKILFYRKGSYSEC